MSLITYRSKKIVQALLINTITINSDYTATLTDGDGQELNVSSDYVLREKPRSGGYYVLGADGFESFIDATLFESDFVAE